MEHKIIISGRFFDQRDLRYIQNGKLKIETFPKPAFIKPDQVKALQNACREADLLIIAMFGSSPDDLNKFPFNSIRVPKAYWSFDSHHSADQELKFTGNFDRLFIAHSPYLDKFKGYDAAWMPCCYFRFGIDNLIRIMNGQIPLTDGVLQRFFSRFIRFSAKKRTIDVAFPHHSYPLGDREKLADKACKLMESQGLRVFLKPVKSGWPYMKTLLNTKIVWNISLLDDLNNRNFEAWALNRVLLTNEVPDHKHIDSVNLGHTYFFDRNLRDFETTLASALDDTTQVNTYNSIIGNHMLIHRYVDIINHCLSTDYSVADCSRFKNDTTVTAE